MVYLVDAAPEQLVAGEEPAGLVGKYAVLHVGAEMSDELLSPFTNPA